MIALYAPAAKQVTIELYQQMGEKGLLTPLPCIRSRIPYRLGPFPSSRLW